MSDFDTKVSDEKKWEPTKYRAFVFTHQNYTEKDINNIVNLSEQARYMIIGFETAPTTGTKHIQGYIYFNNERSVARMKKRFPHFCEIARGNALANKKYCSKEGNFLEYGEMPSQGTRSDINAFRDSILDGMSEEDIIQNHAPELAKYDRFYQRLRTIVLKKKQKNRGVPEVHVRIGDPGMGKSRYIHDTYNEDDIYQFENGDGSAGSTFWNDYDGQKIILIDDFDSSQFKLTYFLKLLDRYKMRLNTKGGFTYLCAEKIYITTNLDVDRWYPNCSPIHKEAITRRLTSITHLRQGQAQSTHNIASRELYTEPLELSLLD